MKRRRAEAHRDDSRRGRGADGCLQVIDHDTTPDEIDERANRITTRALEFFAAAQESRRRAERSVTGDAARRNRAHAEIQATTARTMEQTGQALHAYADAKRKQRGDGDTSQRDPTGAEHPEVVR